MIKGIKEEEMKKIEDRKEFRSKWGLFKDWEALNYRLYSAYGKNVPGEDATIEDWETVDSSGIWLHLSIKGVLPYRIDIVLELLRRLSELDDNGLEELILSESNVYPEGREEVRGIFSRVRSTYRDTLRQKKVSEKWSEGDLNDLLICAYTELLRLVYRMNIKSGRFNDGLNKIAKTFSAIIDEELKDEILAEFWKENNASNSFK